MIAQILLRIPTEDREDFAAFLDGALESLIIGAYRTWKFNRRWRANNV